MHVSGDFIKITYFWRLCVKWRWTWYQLHLSEPTVLAYTAIWAPKLSIDIRIIPLWPFETNIIGKSHHFSSGHFGFWQPSWIFSRVVFKWSTGYLFLVCLDGKLLTELGKVHVLTSRQADRSKFRQTLRWKYHDLGWYTIIDDYWSGVNGRDWAWTHHNLSIVSPML